MATAIVTVPIQVMIQDIIRADRSKIYWLMRALGCALSHIDRATRWVFIRIFNSKAAANAWRFLRGLELVCQLRIRTILTDNGKEFTDRLFGLRKRTPSGKHEFDKLCAAFDIEH